MLIFMYILMVVSFDRPFGTVALLWPDQGTADSQLLEMPGN